MTSGIYIADFIFDEIIISPCRIIFNKQKTNIFMLKRYLTENHVGQGLAPAEKTEYLFLTYNPSGLLRNPPPLTQWRHFRNRYNRKIAVAFRHGYCF